MYIKARKNSTETIRIETNEITTRNHKGKGVITYPILIIINFGTRKINTH